MLTEGLADKSETGVMILRTEKVSLQLATKMANPWAGAMDCWQSNWKACSCGNWGRWYPNGMAPIGCVKNTLASVYALAKFVDTLGYTAHLSGGSLLGAMRCGSFIPWDYDADVQVRTNTVAEARALASKINAWAGGPQKPKTIFVTIDGSAQGRLLSWRPSHPGATKNGNVHLGVYVSDMKEPPLIPCVLNDIVLHCPANYNAMLSKHYGADWKSTPKRWKSWQSGVLRAPVQVDVKRVDACQHRMSAIGAALANMRLPSAPGAVMKPKKPMKHNEFDRVFAGANMTKPRV